MNPLRAWNRFWFGPISARPLGMVRIIYGVLVLAHLALLTVDLDYWFTDAGLYQGDEARLAAGPLRFSPLQWIQDPVSVRIAFGIVAALAVAFTLGWRTRIVSILLYLGLLSIYHRNIPSNCGPDLLLLITSFYLMLSPCGAALSLDARRLARQRGTVAEPVIVPWAQRLFQVQLCLVYFSTATLKCHGTTWFAGTAIHYILFNREVAQFDLEWLAGYPLVINLMTHGAVVIELSLAFLLWFRPTRRWVAVAGVLLHAGIVPLVNAPLFGELMTTLYLLFLDRDELDALLGLFDPRRWFGRRRQHGLEVPGRLDAPSGLQGWHQLELAFGAGEAATGLVDRG